MTLHTIDKAPIPAVVEAAEVLLALAQSGDVVGVAIAAAHHGRHTGTSFELGEATISDLYLGIERLKLRLLEVELR